MTAGLAAIVGAAVGGAVAAVGAVLLAGRMASRERRRDHAQELTLWERSRKLDAYVDLMAGLEDVRVRVNAMADPASAPSLATEPTEFVKDPILGRLILLASDEIRELFGELVLAASDRTDAFHAADAEQVSRGHDKSVRILHQAEERAREEMGSIRASVPPAEVARVDRRRRRRWRRRRRRRPRGTNGRTDPG